MRTLGVKMNIETPNFEEKENPSYGRDIEI